MLITLPVVSSVGPEMVGIGVVGAGAVGAGAVPLVAGAASEAAGAWGAGPEPFRRAPGGTYAPGVRTTAENL